MRTTYVGNIAPFLLVVRMHSVIEDTAVNCGVVGSSRFLGAKETREYGKYVYEFLFILGPMVKRLRHRPFTAVTRVRFSLGSFIILNHQYFSAT